MIRFFVSPSDISGNTVKLSTEDAWHIRSLRLRPSETFIVCDGQGSDFVCLLGGHGNGSPSATAEIVKALPSLGEPTIKCSVYIAYAKGERLDYAVQKSVELGACAIILFPSERCVAIPRDTAKKNARCQRIALETAKQCGRGVVPPVSSIGSLQAAVKQAALACLPLFFYECEEQLRLMQALEKLGGLDAVSLVKQYGLDAASLDNRGGRDTVSLDNQGGHSTISVMTGPEGGFEPHEAEFAKSAGMLAVSLGSRILRCETAPAAALAAIMFHSGNL